MKPTIVVTTGEPAGIGPDIALAAAGMAADAQLLFVGSEALLRERARQLGATVSFTPYTSGTPAACHEPGCLPLIDVPLSAPCTPGELNPKNSRYVLAQLELAAELCRSGEADAMVTSPLHKAVINDSGVPFSGHTEFLAQHFALDDVVMMLTSGVLRVALATTHLPLRAVADAISQEGLERQIRIISAALQKGFGVAKPRITVLGVNPHAGEGGVLGQEELEVINPVVTRLREEGFSITGPVSADSAFTKKTRAQTDVYLAMYHDQGLPVLKAEGFGEAINVTLGLPIIRTSVDHGTALDLAGTGEAQSSSLEAAIQLAIDLSKQRASSR